MGPLQVPQLNLAQGTISGIDEEDFEQPEFFDVENATKLTAGQRGLNSIQQEKRKLVIIEAEAE